MQACASVTLLNFSITSSGLEELLLEALLQADKPELQEAALEIATTAMRRQQQASQHAPARPPRHTAHPRAAPLELADLGSRLST